MNQIGQIASGLMDYEFYYITGDAQRQAELQTISGTLSGRIGELNALINQNFSFTGSDGNPYPRLQYEESEILQLIYIRDYNRRESQKILRGIYDTNVVTTSNDASTTASATQTDNDWIELREGDTVIKRSSASLTNTAANKTTVSAKFADMSKVVDDRLKDLIYSYNMYGAVPRQVMGDDCLSTESLDSDGDGVGDKADAFPDDPKEWKDSDGDGIGDNSDPDIVDSDEDGVVDAQDAFPDDPTETVDSDGDGVGDNSDAFPNDPAETADSDGDGTGDNSDPDIVDSDGDGVVDAQDAFPNDPTETVDSDGDGVGDNADAYPNDPTRTALPPAPTTSPWSILEAYSAPDVSSRRVLFSTANNNYYYIYFIGQTFSTVNQARIVLNAAAGSDEVYYETYGPTDEVILNLPSSVQTVSDLQSHLSTIDFSTLLYAVGGSTLNTPYSSDTEIGMFLGDRPGNEASLTDPLENHIAGGAAVFNYSITDKEVYTLTSTPTEYRGCTISDNLDLYNYLSQTISSIPYDDGSTNFGTDQIELSTPVNVELNAGVFIPVIHLAKNNNNTSILFNGGVQALADTYQITYP